MVFYLYHSGRLPHTSSFTLLFRIHDIVESGLIERWTKKHYPREDQCTGLQTTASTVPIAVTDAQGAFYLLALGVALAALTAVTEVYIHACALRIRDEDKQPVIEDSDPDAQTKAPIFQVVTPEMTTIEGFPGKGFADQPLRSAFDVFD